MSDVEPDEVPPTEVPEQPAPGAGYWPDEWQRHIERAEQNLADTPPPEIPVAPPPVIGNELPATEPAKAFDPGEHTVGEVEDYVSEHPDEREAILAAEEAGKGRVTLVDWLTGGY